MQSESEVRQPLAEAVHAAIEQALEEHAEFTARHIIVTVGDGAVTLYGRVDSWSEKDEILRATSRVPGVQSVEDHVHVVEE